jgi:hypothetical protein
MGKRREKSVNSIEGFDTDFNLVNLRERFGNKHILFFGETKKVKKELMGNLSARSKFCIIYNWKTS